MHLINPNPPDPNPKSFCYWDPRHSMNQQEEDLIKHSTARALDESLPVEPPRGHLGFSQIGNPDDRLLWFRFRWSLPEDISPRARRIFRLGHILEGEVIDLLSRVPGVTVHDRDPETGRQFRFEFLGGHFSGSMDGCIQGLPESSKWHVLEIKTVNAKRFAELQKSGVEAWSPEYFAQMQCYMAASGMERALFVAYCKDSSEIYTERVKLKKMEFDGYLVKAERLILATEPPAPLYPSQEKVPAHLVNMNPVYSSPIYWGRQLPEPNCRNCRFSEPLMDRPEGCWGCRLSSPASVIPILVQRAGCPSHNYLPALMPGNLVAEHSDCTEYQLSDVTFWNAEEHVAAIHQQVFSSKELCHLSRTGAGICAEVLADPLLNEIRTELDGRIVEPADVGIEESDIPF